MADLADVENALAAQIAYTLYALPLATELGSLIVTESGVSLTASDGSAYLPGSYQVSAASWAWPPVVSGSPGTPVPGTVKLYRGWPESSNLLGDLTQGFAHVSVFAESGVSRNTSRYEPQWVVPSFVASTLAVKIAGQVLTFSGTPAVGQIVSVQAVAPADLVQVITATGQAATVFTYSVQASDTLATIATAVAALVSGATAAGPTVTLPGHFAACAVGMTQTASQVIRQQTQRIRVSCWCPSPAARDALCQLVDVQLALVELAGQFTTPDGSFCRLTFDRTYINDAPTKDRVWRRDLCYMVEYPTLQTQPQAQMGAGIISAIPTGPANTASLSLPVNPVY